MDISSNRVERQKLFKNDPIGYLIDSIPGRAVIRITVLCMGIYATFIILFGVIISTTRNAVFISILDSRELPLVLFTSFVYFPLVWTIYQWQVRGIKATILQLAENGIFTDSKNKLNPEHFFENIIVEEWGKRSNFIIILIITFSTLVFFTISTFINPSGFITMAIMKDQLWWKIYPLYFLFLWTPLQFINVYIIAWILLRQVFVIKGLNNLIDNYSISPKLFHPDKCNGLAPIGTYAIRSTMIIILFAVWITIQILSPTFYGKPMNFDLTTTIQLLFFTFAAPALLIAVVWKTHSAMCEAKNRATEAIAKQIRLLLDKNTKDYSKPIESIKSLKEKLDIIDREMKTWPFRRFEARNFSLASIAPLFISITSFIFQEYLSKYIFP